MTTTPKKLTPGRLAEIKKRAVQYSDDDVLALLDHITALEAERDALARVAYQAAIDVTAFEQCLILSGTDPEYAAERVRPMREALRALQEIGG